MTRTDTKLKKGLSMECLFCHSNTKLVNYKHI